MNSSYKKTIIKWTAAVLVLILAVGCSSLGTPTTGQSNDGTGTSSATQPNDPAKTLLLNMMQTAEQGKVINCDFPAKTTGYQDVEKAWGPADTIDYIAAAKGRYATYASHNVVFGINKGDQVFEVRSLARHQFTSISLDKVKEVFGSPAYDAKFNGLEIIGYTAGPEYKIEFVFSPATTTNPNPVIDHYNVLYPQGTTNMMANDPGRQW